MSLQTLLKEEMYLHDRIDRVLQILSPDASQINRAIELTEERLYSEALLAGLDEPESMQNKKYNVTGNTKLRWMLDNDSPTFSKVDESTAETYRKRLLQFYHPDRPFGDLEKFELVKMAYATANVELLALLTMGMGHVLDPETLQIYENKVEERLARLKSKMSFSILQKYVSQGPEVALYILQEELDKRAKLMIINLAITPEKEKANEEG